MIEKTQHCHCGNDTYRLKFNEDGDVWAVCAECSRPTGSVGVGEQKKRVWEEQN